MEYKLFGKTDLYVSRIAFGTWAFGGDWGQLDIEQNKAAIIKALDLGINFFDTAQAYGWGISEKLLGEALKDQIKSNRQKLILATKGGLRMDGKTLLRDSSPKCLRQGVEESLKFLRTDYIDLYQVHWPDSKTPFAETAEALESMVKAGLIRYVGVSNFSSIEMADFEKTRKIDSLQPPYHMFRRDIETNILPYAMDHDIGVLVYGPLAHGLLSGKFNINKTFAADDWRSRSNIFMGDLFKKNLEVIDRLKEFARQKGSTLIQLGSAWTLSNPAVDVAIVGARTPQQIVESTSGADILLTPADISQIEEIMKDAISFTGPTPEGIN